MDTICLCSHDAEDHTRRTGACRAPDSYGIRCTCPAWVVDDSCPDDDEDGAHDEGDPAGQ